jgi:soluble lytic murein transglycosylase-like protein
LSRQAVIRALFLVCIFPLLAKAQEPAISRAGGGGGGESVKPMASLTTADVVNPQDYTLRPVKPSAGANASPATKEMRGQPPAPRAAAATAATTEAIGTVARGEASPPEGQTMAAMRATTGDARIDALIRGAAARSGVDPQLVFAVMRQESSFNWRALSPKGASGLMQLMPATARRFGVQNIFDPAQNIEGGARYLRFLLDTFGGDVELALAGYNAGEHAVARYGNRVPPYRETQDYVRRISAHYQRLASGQSVPLKQQPVVAAKPSEVELVSGMRALTQH